MRFESACALAAAALFMFPLGSWAQDPRATLAQVPEGQFVVTYQRGELTIKARNAPLADVLREVCNQVGAVLDLPSASNERVIAILGPGPTKEILVSLLDNSQFDYAVLDSAADQSTLARVSVFPKTNDSKTSGPFEQVKVSQGEVTSADSKAGTDTNSARENSGLTQIKELLTAAKAEVAAGTTIDTQAANEDGGNADASGAQQEIDLAKALQQVEAQINAAGNAAAATTNSNSAPTVQQADATAPQNAFSIPRHRRR